MSHYRTDDDDGAGHCGDDCTAAGPPDDEVEQSDEHEEAVSPRQCRDEPDEEGHPRPPAAHEHGAPHRQEQDDEEDADDAEHAVAECQCVRRQSHHRGEIAGDEDDDPDEDAPGDPRPARGRAAPTRRRVRRRSAVLSRRPTGHVACRRRPLDLLSARRRGTVPHGCRLDGMAGRSRRDVERRSAHVRTVAARGCAVAIMRRHLCRGAEERAEPGPAAATEPARPVLLRRGWLT